MPVDRAVAADLAARVLRLYTDVEETLIEGLARRLAFGLDRPTWATDKLAAVGEVRRWVQGLLDALAGPMRDAVADALVEAFGRGGDAAQAELARYATGAARLIEVQRALSGSQAALAMASADLAGRLERMHFTIVRSTLDIYRDTVTRATGDVLHGAMTRRAAAERAWLRLLDQGVTAFVDVRGRRWSLAGYVEMATRTATAQAAVQGHLDRLETAGIDLVIVSDSPQECVRCLVPGTVVEGPAPTWRSRLEYSGDVITITTAGGNDLTGTPEHPVLTARGWRRLDELAPGDKVARHDGQQRYAGVMPDGIQVPTVIEKAGESRIPFLFSGPSGSDFDGDIANGEIGAVFPDGYLLSVLDAESIEPLRKLLLVLRIGTGPAFLGLSDLLLVLRRERDATRCRVCWREHARALLRAGVLPALEHALTDVSRALLATEVGLVGDDAMVARPSRDAGTTQVIADSSPADAEGGADLLRRLAGQVELDEITSLVVSQYRGHVWDLSTEPGWFVANGIVTHNCRPWEGRVLQRYGGLGARTISVRHATEDRMIKVKVAGSVAEAIAAGLMHPNCRHNLSAYLPGLTVVPINTADPEGDAARQQLRAMERQVRAFKQRAIGVEPFDKRAAARYRGDARRVQAAIAQHVAAHDLTRRRDREQLDLGNRRSA